MASAAQEPEFASGAEAPAQGFDWRKVAYLVCVSRALDRLEEERLAPERKIV